MRDELNAELRRLNRRSSDPRKGVGLSKQQYGGYRSWNHLRSVYQHTCHLFIFFICLFIYLFILYLKMTNLQLKQI